jgi:hypothetical protein
MTATWKMPYFLSELLRGLIIKRKIHFYSKWCKLFFEIIEKTLHLFVEKPLQQPEIKTV